jgi:hypothetical protein
MEPRRVGISAGSIREMACRFRHALNRNAQSLSRSSILAHANATQSAGFRWNRRAAPALHGKRLSISGIDGELGRVRDVAAETIGTYQRWFLARWYEEEAVMKALIVLATLLAATATVGGGLAEGAEEKSMKSAEAKFESLDRDRDRALSKREVKSDASIAAQFDSWDINLDGYISKAEYTAYLERAAQAGSQRE